MRWYLDEPVHSVVPPTLERPVNFCTNYLSENIYVFLFI